MSTRALLLCLLLVSCGDPVAGGEFRGELIFEYGFRVRAFLTPDAPRIRSPRAGLFWAPGGVHDSEIEALREQPGVGAAFAIGDHVNLYVYDPPPASLLASTTGGARYGVGRVLLFDDLDGDAEHQPGEPIFGGSGEIVILYAPKAIPAADSPTGRPLPAGMRRSVWPIPCAPAPDLPLCEDAPRGVCEGPGDCPGGRCILELGTYSPRGLCSATAGAQCRPADSAFVPAADSGGAWLPACTEDDACPAPSDFRCDRVVGACLPLPLPPILLTTEFELPSVCAPSP